MNPALPPFLESCEEAQEENSRMILLLEKQNKAPGIVLNSSPKQPKVDVTEKVQTAPSSCWPSIDLSHVEDDECLANTSLFYLPGLSALLAIKDNYMQSKSALGTFFPVTPSIWSFWFNYPLDWCCSQICN